MGLSCKYGPLQLPNSTDCPFFLKGKSVLGSFLNNTLVACAKSLAHKSSRMSEKIFHFNQTEQIVSISICSCTFFTKKHSKPVSIFITFHKEVAIFSKNELCCGHVGAFSAQVRPAAEANKEHWTLSYVSSIVSTTCVIKVVNTHTHTHTHTHTMVVDWNSMVEALLHVCIPPLSQHCLL